MKIDWPNGHFDDGSSPKLTWRQMVVAMIVGTFVGILFIAFQLARG
jgi:hypothetical protein